MHSSGWEHTLHTVFTPEESTAVGVSSLDGWNDGIRLGKSDGIMLGAGDGGDSALQISGLGGSGSSCKEATILTSCPVRESSVSIHSLAVVSYAALHTYKSNPSGRMTSLNDRIGFTIIREYNDNNVGHSVAIDIFTGQVELKNLW
jgi:hypothetical protein